jgi:hypothetical protein
MTVDLTKPVQTACGYPARVLATDCKGQWPVVAAYTKNGCEFCLQFGADGICLANSSYSLVNVPPPEPLEVVIRITPEDAAMVAYACSHFCDVLGAHRFWNRQELLAHFTALAEQQRGEG